MTEKILHMMVGLPRSGKSTIVKTLGYPIVEPDAIRLAIHGTLWKANVEPLIWGFAHSMVQALFYAGHDNVVLDATNHTDERRQMWQSPDWLVKYIVVDTPKEICIQRAKDTDREYLVPVIERIAAQWEHPHSGRDC